MHEYFQKVEKGGEEIVVTSDKIPILKIVSLKKTGNVDDIFADARGKVKYRADILDPETGEWGDL